MTTTTMLALLTAHLVGDWVCQSDWMALNKSKRWDALAAHVVIVAVFLLPWGWRFALVNFALHFCVDAVTSRVTSRLWFFERHPGAWQQQFKYVPEIIDPWTPIVGRRHWFFVAIGIDQWLHGVCLVLTYRWLV